MKITKSQLQKIIKEELLKEAGGPPGRQFGRTMGDLDADAKMRETDFLSSANRRSVTAEMLDMVGTDLGELTDALQFFAMRADQADLDEFMRGTGRAGYEGA